MDSVELVLLEAGSRCRCTTAYTFAHRVVEVGFILLGHLGPLESRRLPYYLGSDQGHGC